RRHAAPTEAAAEVDALAEDRRPDVREPEDGHRPEEGERDRLRRVVLGAEHGDQRRREDRAVDRGGVEVGGSVLRRGLVHRATEDVRSTAYSVHLRWPTRASSTSTSTRSTRSSTARVASRTWWRGRPSSRCPRSRSPTTGPWRERSSSSRLRREPASSR